MCGPQLARLFQRPSQNSGANRTAGLFFTSVRTNNVLHQELLSCLPLSPPLSRRPLQPISMQQAAVHASSSASLSSSYATAAASSSAHPLPPRISYSTAPAAQHLDFAYDQPSSLHHRHDHLLQQQQLQQHHRLHMQSSSTGTQPLTLNRSSSSNNSAADTTPRRLSFTRDELSNSHGNLRHFHASEALRQQSLEIARVTRS